MSTSKSRGESSDHGLHTVLDKDALAPGITDIVAIHGLNGHYQKTWTDEESRYNWLWDVWKRDGWAGGSLVNKVRVMSFSYNAKVKHSKSTADIFDFADQLLEGLLAKRDSDEEEIRPLVFICHSLGGIVFKQAFNAATGRTRYQDLAKHTRGVLFFGTPHKGSDLAGLGSVLANFLRLSSLGASTNAQLVRDLARNSAKLEHISDTFLQHASSLKVVAFYELETMDMMSSLVVDKTSAILNMSREISVGLNRNHRNMCKFSSRSDPMLDIVMKRLAFVINDHDQIMATDVKNALLRALATSNPETHKARNPSPASGTCAWLSSHKSYKRWLESKSPGLLWLSADPGCGKSVLASFLVDSLRPNTATHDRNVCFFFFKSDNVEQNSGITALQAVLHQVLHSQRQLLSTAVQELQQPSDVRDMRCMWKALVTILQQPDAREVICVLDGLDECEAGARRQLIEMLSSHFSPKSQPAHRHTKLRVIITSRHDNALKVAFDRPLHHGTNMSNAPERIIIRLRGEDETDAISHDIGLVIDAEIAEITEIGLPAEILDEFRTQLVARADRTFLWVTLIIQHLKERVVAGASRRELQDILRSRDIYVIYSQLLSTRPHVAKARKLLSIVLGAMRPLNTAELSIALAIEPEFETFDDTSPNRRRPGQYDIGEIEDNLVYPFENHIKALCGNFIRIIKDKVYFVHETAREFLLRDEDFDNEEAPEEPFWLDDDDDTTIARGESPSLPKSDELTLPWKSSFEPSQCHAICLEICVTYIYCLGRAISTRHSENPSPLTSAFLEYAAIAWIKHFGEVRDKLNPMHFPYYQNLCHPRFPGFAAWLTIRERTSMPGGWTKPMGADDDVQDYYVALFDLDPRSGEGGPVTSGVLSMRSMEEVLSSNPGAGANHYFPVKTDSSGWVSLDLETDALSNPWTSD